MPREEEERTMRDEFVVIPFPDNTDGWNPFGAGTRVKYAGQQEPAERTGTVVTWGRGVTAHERFTRNEGVAEQRDQKLTADDYEPLMDAEGPAVVWDGMAGLDWFPGQSLSGTIEPMTEEEYREQAPHGMLKVRGEEGDPEFVVVMTLVIPDQAWRKAYGPHGGPILAKEVRQYLEYALFVDGTQIAAKVHTVRGLPR
jgi:hypothetical protein